MGIFDIFTGAPAKRAAEENTARLGQLKTEGTGVLNTGQTNALGSLDTAAGAYAPLSDLAKKYGAGTGLYMDSLGLNGAEGNTRATGAFQAGSGYQYAVDQSLDQTRRAAARDGSLAGGNTLAALSDRAGNLANQEYGNWQGKLGGLISPELSATSGAATGVAGANIGKAGVYQDTAGKIVGLDSNVTSGINNNNTQAANAQMAGSGNLWNFGLNGLTALASGGGTSLLGGLKGLNLGSGMMGGGSPTGYGR